MLRRLLIFCSFGSLLLFAAVCVLWVRSYGLTEQLRLRRPDGEGWIRTATGKLFLYLHVRDQSQRPAEWFGLRYSTGAAQPVGFELYVTQIMGGEIGDTTASYGRAGFAWVERRNIPRRNLIVHAAAPFWAMALATAALPLGLATVRLRSRARARLRRKGGQCVACGYDLRGTPAGGRCPECGAAPPAEPPDSARPIPARVAFTAGFVAGFAAAAGLFLLLVLPISNQSVRNTIDAEEQSPSSAAMYRAYESAANGDAKTAAAQLKMLLERSNAYRNGDGSAPKVWWPEIANLKVPPTTQPGR